MMGEGLMLAQKLDHPAAPHYHAPPSPSRGGPPLPFHLSQGLLPTAMLPSMPFYHSHFSVPSLSPTPSTLMQTPPSLSFSFLISSMHTKIETFQPLRQNLLQEFGCKLWPCRPPASRCSLLPSPFQRGAANCHVAPRSLAPLFKL
jgi:hypothetical protein